MATKKPKVNLNDTSDGMSISVLQETLAGAIGAVIKAAKERSTLPVLSSLLIEGVDEGTARVSATDLEMAITSTFGAKVGRVGAICLPARSLQDYVSALPQGAVSIQVNAVTQTAEFQCGRYKGHIKGTDASEFPAISSPAPSAYTLYAEPAAFEKAMRQVVVSTAVDDSRPVLTGVVFEWNGRTLRLASADGFRLTELTLPVTAPLENFTAKVIVPRRAVLEAIRLGKGQDEPIRITLKEDSVVFHFENDTISTQVIEGNFPDFEQIIPKHSAVTTKLSVAELQRAIQASTPFARDAHNIVVFEINNANGSGAHVGIRATSAQTGNNNTMLDAEVNGEGHQFALNAQFVKEVLATFGGEFEILTNSAETPVVFRQPKDDDYVHVIMPMHLDEK